MCKKTEGPLRVLIIEDNRDFADTLCIMFDLLGHQAIAVHSGPQGIAKAKEYDPNIIFCDIGLPGMSGFEVAEEIRRVDALKHVRLVALSGYAQSQDIQKALESGYTCHVAKPVDMATIKRMLSELVSGKGAPGGDARGE